MLSAESLNLGLMLAESGVLENAVNELMAKPQLMVLTERSPAAKRAIKSHIRRWRHGVKRRLSSECMTEELKQEIDLYQQLVQMDEQAFSQNSSKLIKQLEGVSGFYLEARRLLEKNSLNPNPMFQSYLCNKWHQHLAETIREAQEKQLEVHKEKLLSDLYQRIETYQTLEGVRDAGDVNSVGRLWDMAAAKLSQQDISLLQDFVHFLSKNQDLKNIAEQLGRMANLVTDPSLQKAPKEDLQLVEERSDNVPDDIDGICQSDNIDKMLPNESLFLTDPELEIVFYKHLVDKRLLNYKLKGAQRTLRKVKTFTPSSDNNELEKGPFIICVDASGSMTGFPEQCAKAMAYALMQIAVQENRDCYVMLFSTDHISYELTGDKGLREAMNFLTYRFHGGTDLEPVLEKSIELMQGDRYKNADLVVVSDFIAPKQSDDLVKKIEVLKAHNNRFHAINLSKYGNPGLMSMFDHCWHYHPSLMGRLLSKWQAA